MQHKIRQLIAELDAEFIERQEVTRGLALAALVGEHAFLLGPPGTGKSMMSRAFCNRIGGEWYEWLLTRFTTPEELFGPVDLASMKTGSHKRITKGKVPEADVAFLDEIWKCLSGDTLLTLQDGTRCRLDSLRERPIVTAITSEMTLITQRANRVIHKPRELVYKLELNSGRSLRATGDHLFLVRKSAPIRRQGDQWEDWGDPQWLPLQNINSRDCVATPRIVPCFGQHVMPLHEVDLLALILADGGTTGGQVHYFKKDMAMVERAKHAVNNMDCQLVRSATDDHSYRVNGTAVRDLIERHGMRNVKSPQRQIPLDIFRLQRDLLARFIGVLWCGDGTINGWRIQYDSSSKAMIDGFQHLCLRFGVHGRVHDVTSRTSISTRHAYRWTISKQDAIRFRDEFGPFAIGRKGEQLQKADLSTVTSSRRFATQEDIRWDRVISILPDKEEETYCLEMNGEPNFIANDIVVHNCSSAILNALLSVTNERIYHNNGSPQKCPLRTCLTASNEIPDQEDDSLKALYDRIMMRFVVGPLSDQGLIALINRPRGKKSTPAVVITIAELEAAQNEIEAVTLPADLGETFADMRSKLRQENIDPSGRRLDNAVKLLQASAWLDGRTQVQSEDLEVLIHVLWDEPSQIPAVKRIVLQAADPNWQKALEIFEAAENVAAEAFKTAEGGDKITVGAEAGAKVKVAIEELGKLGKSARIAELVTKTQELQKNIIRRCFGMAT